MRVVQSLPAISVYDILIQQLVSGHTTRASKVDIFPLCSIGYLYIFEAHTLQGLHNRCVIDREGLYY